MPMNEEELNDLLDNLTGTGETEWIEFKMDNFDPTMIGERLSALSNGACLFDQKYGYLVYGVEDKTCEIKGTSKKFKELKKGTSIREAANICNCSPSNVQKVKKLLG